MDRQAQQAFRERTKAQIQDLEEEVETLHRQANENEDIWRHENARLRKQVQRLSQRLRQIRDLTSNQAEPMLDVEQDRTVTEPAIQAMNSTANTHYPESIDDGAPDNAENELHATDCTMVEETTDVLSHRYHDEGHQASQISSEMQQYPSDPRNFDGDSPSISAMNVASSVSQNGGPQMNQDGEPSNGMNHVSMAHKTVSAESTFPTLLPPTPLSAQGTAPYVAVSITSQRRQVYEAVCDHSHRTCPFDHILVNHLESKRSNIAQGESISSAIGPSEPDIAGIFQPEKAARSHQLSRMLVEMMLTFAHVDRPERVAFMYKIHKTMRVSNVSVYLRACF